MTTTKIKRERVSTKMGLPSPVAYIAGKEANSLNSDDIYNHFKDIGAYKDNTPSKAIDLVQNQWFHNHYSALDEAYFSDDDTTNLIGKDSDIN